MLAQHGVQRLAPRFRPRRARRSTSGDALQPIGSARSLSADSPVIELGDRLRQRIDLLAEFGGAKIVGAAAGGSGSPPSFQDLGEAGGVIERVQRAGHAAPLRLRLRRLLQVRRGSPRTSSSAAEAGAATPGSAFSFPPESEAATETASVLSASATARRAASTATTGLTSAAGSRTRSIGDSFDGRRRSTRRVNHCVAGRSTATPDDIVGRVICGEQRRSVERGRKARHKRGREWKGGERDQRRDQLEQHIGEREALGRRARADGGERRACRRPDVLSDDQRRALLEPDRARVERRNGDRDRRRRGLHDRRHRQGRRRRASGGRPIPWSQPTPGAPSTRGRSDGCRLSARPPMPCCSVVSP